MNTTIQRKDILDLLEYEKIRQSKKQEIVALKKNRRVAVGPYATFYFENYQTMWWQIHEMLRIEKGGENQIEDELKAYNPMIPNGNELKVTVMFEIDSEQKRKVFLHTIGGIEKTMYFEFENEQIYANEEGDVERTSEEGKASSVHFMHFNFTQKQINTFKQSKKIMLGFNHPNYQHISVLSPLAKQELIKDFIN